jgi:hypothetical protein
MGEDAGGRDGRGDEGGSSGSDDCRGAEPEEDDGGGGKRRAEDVAEKGTLVGAVAWLCSWEAAAVSLVGVCEGWRACWSVGELVGAGASPGSLEAGCSDDGCSDVCSGAGAISVDSAIVEITVDRGGA